VAWSYDPGLPSAKDRVRLAVGDTDGANPLRQDETINALVLAHGEAEATAKLAEGLATQYAQQPDSVDLGGLAVTWKDRVKAWLELAARTRDEAAATAAAAGGATASLATTRGEELAAEYRRPEWWSG